MALYWIVVLLALINCLIYNKKFNRIVSLLCLISMCLLAGLRADSIGTDSQVYSERYYNQMHGNISEFLYYFIIIILNKCNASYTLFFLLLSILFYLPVYYVSKKESLNGLKYVVLLLIISNNTYFMDSFNAVRQLSASGMLLLSYYLITNKRYFIAFFIYILAIGLHTTSFFYLPIILFSLRDISYRKVCVILVIVTIYAFCVSSFFSFDLSYVLRYGQFLDTERYNTYFDNTKYGHGVNINGIIKGFLVPSFICAMSYKILNGNYFCRLYFWGIVLLGIMLPLLNISFRITQGLTICELIVLSMAIPKATIIQKKIFWIYYVVYLSFFLFELCTWFAMPENLGPYKSSLAMTLLL